MLLPKVEYGIGVATMTSSAEFLESGEIARLIPVIADSRREQRVASVFLATVSAVPDFAHRLLQSIRIRLGKRSVLDTYTEVVLKGQKDSKDRPDGLIVVSSSGKTWSALVEAKIGSSKLDDEQVQRYLQIARENDIDAVITISNQFVARPEHSPINAPKHMTKKVSLFHWSWKMVLTEAVLLQTRESIRDPDQAFILREFVRFISHDSIGVSGFDRMPAKWKDAVTLVKSGGVIGKTSCDATEIVSAWHQEVRDLALQLSRHLATEVDVKLPRSHATDVEARLKDDCSKLSVSNRLEVEYNVPNAASSLLVKADLIGQTIRVGMEVDAPQDKQRSSARINWLLRQLKSATSEKIFVRIVWPSRAQDTVCRLEELREEPTSVVSASPLSPKSFEVFYLSDNSRRFSGRSTFIEDLEQIVPEFYDNVGQRLERWVPKPPKPVATAEADLENDEKAQTKPAVSTAAPADAVESPRLTPGNQHSVLLELPQFLRRAIKGNDPT